MKHFDLKSGFALPILVVIRISVKCISVLDVQKLLAEKIDRFGLKL